MDRGERDAHLDQEADERGDQQAHRQDERERDDGPDVKLYQLRDEQERDDEARHHRARRGEHQRAVDHRHAPVEQAQLPDMAIMFGAARQRMQILQRAGAIDDARQAPDQHVEQRADPRQHEDGRERKLNRLRDRGDGGEGVHPHLLRWRAARRKRPFHRMVTSAR